MNTKKRGKKIDKKYTLKRDTHIFTMCHRTWPFCTQCGPRTSLVDQYGGPSALSCAAGTLKALIAHGFSPTHHACRWSHLHDRMHACCSASRRPYKRGRFGQVSQSVFCSWVDHTARFLTVTFPWLHRMHRPHQTTCYLVVWVHSFP